MPRLSTVVDDLLEIELKLLVPFTNSKNHHLMECQLCGHQFTATPIAKLQAYKKYNNKGCPKCTEQRKKQKESDAKESFLQKIENRDYDVLTEGYDGNQVCDFITVRRRECGHTFDIKPTNLIHRNVICPLCSKKEK